MFGKKDTRNFVEKNNDSLVFWQYIGTPVFYIFGVILIFGIIIGFFKISSTIKANKEANQIEQTYNTRSEIFNDYLSKNPKTFTNINKTWNEDNIFYAQNNNGIFSVRFVDTRIYEVIYTTNTGFQQVLYKE